MLKQKLFLAAQHCLPQHWLSRLMGAIANCQQRKLKNWMIGHFINHYQVNMEQAESADIEHYPSFNAFFTRALKPEARPLAKDKNCIVSPVDGSIIQVGSLEQLQLFQAKGHYYSLIELIGGEGDQHQDLRDGQFSTIYLSPKDYHRVHMPIDGKLTAMTYIPGSLFSVNPLTVDNVPNLFARNERVVCWFETKLGPVAIIFVGAFFVASIKTVWHGVVAPAQANEIKHWTYSGKQQRKFKRGEEIGQFQFGSTVIMIFPQNSISWDNALEAGSSVQLATSMAQVVESDHEKK